jgi:hypothetical protein
LFFFLSVVFLSYGFVYFHGRLVSPAPVAVVAEAPRPPAAPEVTPPLPPPAAVDVELIGTGGRRAGAVTALALGSLRRVVLPLAVLDGSEAALVRTADGHVPIGPVVAVLPAAGLAALVGPEGGLPVADDSASLHLGLDVKALAGGVAVPGEVESTATRREDGSYAYRVSFDVPLGRGIVGLTDESGTRLVGAIASEGGDAGLYDAVRSRGVLAPLLQRASRRPAHPLPARNHGR